MATDAARFAVEVTIELSDRGYLVRLVDAGGTQVTAPFFAPLTGDQVRAFWAMVQTDDTGETAWDAARATGAMLFNALFPATLAERLYVSYRHAYQQQAPLTIRLHLSETPEFSDLPWEYLYDPLRREFPALSLHSPLMRYNRLMHRIRPLPINGPLRMLVVVAAPSGHPRYDAQREWLNLVDTLDHLAVDGRLFVERLQRPTLHDFHRRLAEQDVHIVHFLGHTVYDDQAREGRLVFEDEMGRGRPVSGNHLGQILRDQYTTRLMTIQSCAAEFDLRNPAGLIAASLIPRGVPAAVALPMRFADDLTLGFLHEFYAAIAAFRPVTIAMTEARAAMVAERNTVLWGMPWLAARMEDGFLFDDGTLPKPAQARPAQHQPSLLERVLRSSRLGTEPSQLPGWREEEQE